MIKVVGTHQNKVARIVANIIVTILGLLTIVPFIWMISASFKMQRDVMTVPIQWIPKYWYPDNYLIVLHLGNAARKDYHFFLAYWNSIKLAVVHVSLVIVLSCMSGYAFAKLKFKGSHTLFLVYLAQLMVPSQLTLIPRFSMFSDMGLVGTMWPLVFSGLVSVSSIFLIRQAFMGVPDELRESAMIDGANEYVIWARIMTPMVKPTVAAMATVKFLDSWNSYLDPLVFLSNWRQYTLPIALNQFVGEEVSQYNLTMAACCLTVIPVFIVFLCGQKFFVKGLNAGAVKG